MRRSAEQIEFSRVAGINGRKRDCLAHTDIDHVARSEFMRLTTSCDRAGRTDVNGDKLAAIQEGFRAGRLDRLQLKLAFYRHGAADDHAVVMRIRRG